MNLNLKTCLGKTYCFMILFVFDLFFCFVFCSVVISAESVDVFPKKIGVGVGGAQEVGLRNFCANVFGEVNSYFCSSA